MNFYHKSFIGLMEQRFKGEWCKRKDVEEYIKSTNHTIHTLNCRATDERIAKENLIDEVEKLKIDKKMIHLPYWFVILLLICFLITSNIKEAKAFTKSELKCVAISIYHEGRSESPTVWKKMYQVALNRSKNPKKFKAKSSNLCDVVHSPHYKTYRLRTIKDLKKYEEILTTVKQYHPKTRSKILYFASSKGKTKFRKTFKG